MFLDEIGDMSLEIQKKILRVLEDKNVQRLGEKTIKKIDFRIISATNVNLQESVSSAQFRKDLYFRLEEFPIYLPSLNERKDDIKLLADYFLNNFCDLNNLPDMILTNGAYKNLINHDWVGNIRELKNVITRSAIESETNEITQMHFSTILYNGVNNNELSFKEIIPLEELESTMIHKAFKETNDSASDAAKLLGISRATMYRKLKELGIS